MFDMNQVLRLLSKLNRKITETCKRTQRVKALVIKLTDLSLIPRTHMMEK